MNEGIDVTKKRRRPEQRLVVSHFEARRTHARPARLRRVVETAVEGAIADLVHHVRRDLQREERVLDVLSACPATIMAVPDICTTFGIEDVQPFSAHGLGGKRLEGSAVCTVQF